MLNIILHIELRDIIWAIEDCLAVDKNTFQGHSLCHRFRMTRIHIYEYNPNLLKYSCTVMWMICSRISRWDKMKNFSVLDTWHPFWSHKMHRMIKRFSSVHGEKIFCFAILYDETCFVTIFFFFFFANGVAKNNFNKIPSCYCYKILLLATVVVIAI